jgi:hypothetical protein
MKIMVLKKKYKNLLLIKKNVIIFPDCVITLNASNLSLCLDFYLNINRNNESNRRYYFCWKYYRNRNRNVRIKILGTKPDEGFIFAREQLKNVIKQGYEEYVFFFYKKYYNFYKELPSI